jgi:hypothetical protein
MPSHWNFAWEHPSYCVDTDTPPYPLLPNPAVYTDLVELPSLSAYTNPQRTFNCFINSPANPDFVPSEVSPQLVLDDALPSTLQVQAFSPIYAAAGITNLHLFSMSLTNPANVTAQSVASDGSSAVFPYPTAPDGTTLPAGPYITTITTDPPGASQTTNGMEPIYIAHDDTSYTSAFGVAVVNPSETITLYGAADKYGDGTCAGTPYSYTYVSGGNQIPLVTLPTLGRLALGSASNTISVGSNPTVVIPYNDVTFDNSSSRDQRDQCNNEDDVYSGAQSALVVDTGSNTVSLLDIGFYGYPSGTVSVGASPVAAVIDPSESFAYVANYVDGTISEINLSNVQVTRTLSVMVHPTAVSFDSNGNLWVGGQGNLQLINRTNWSIWTTFPIDGTITGMSYDMAQGAFVSTVLQNGTASSRSDGQTMSRAIAFSGSGGVSYSTRSLVNVATGNSTMSSIAADSAPYALSSLASNLAHPAQTAFNPPIYTSSSGDVVATANGTSFTVSVLATGKVLISGTLPHPIRGVALTPTMLYFTMPESNSLVTLPMQLQ